MEPFFAYIQRSSRSTVNDSSLRPVDVPHLNKLKIRLLLLKNFLDGVMGVISSLGSQSFFSSRFSLLFSVLLRTPTQGVGACKADAVDPWEILLFATRLLDSDRGRLTMCVDRRRVFFGLGAGLSFGCSEPIARLARRRRLLEGLGSSTSKSVGKNAAGAV